MTTASAIAQTLIPPADEQAAPPTLSSIARDCCEQANDLADAVELMLTRIMGDTPLFRELMIPIARQACYDACRAQIRHNRSGFMPPAAVEGAAEANERFKRVARSALLDWPLMDGTRLRDARAPQVRKTAEHYLRQGRTMSATGKWLELIARGLTGTQRVVDAYDEKSLTRLQVKAGARP